MTNLFKQLLLILLWYLLSVSLSVYNKWLFGRNNYNLNYPLFVTSIHFLVQFVCSVLFIKYSPNISLNNQPYLLKSLLQQKYKLMFCGLATGLDIGLSNVSLKNISLAFYTMCKSSSLIFTLLFAFLFKLEKITNKLLLIIIILCLGVFLMVYKDDNSFSFIGFIQVMSAVFFGGLRWSLFKLLLNNKNTVLKHPACSLVCLTPIMFMSMLVTSLSVEYFPSLFYKSEFFGTFYKATQTMSIILLGSAIAYIMIMTEFYLLKTTGIITVTILGILKEVLTIAVSKLLFSDNEHLSKTNISGLIMTMGAIATYNLMKYSSSTSTYRQKAVITDYNEIEMSNSQPNIMLAIDDYSETEPNNSRNVTDED